MAQDEKMMSVLAHITALAGLILPFGNIIGPLVIFLMSTGKPKEHARNSLNFQISVTIYFIALTILGLILSIVLIGFLVFLLMPILGIVVLVLVILATVKASNGEMYNYPATIHFLK